MKKIISKFLATMLAGAALMSVFAFAACGSVTLTDVQLMMPAEKTEYVVGEKFDPTGLVLTGVYSDGTRKPITDYKIDKTDGLTLEDKEIIITYQDKTFIQPITVINLGDKVVLTLANGVDRCCLHADGHISLQGGGGGGSNDPHETAWTWDGKDLRIWLTNWVDGKKEDHKTEMEVVKDELENYSFQYELRGRWHMNYFISYNEWSQVLTPDVTYPLGE